MEVANRIGPASRAEAVAALARCLEQQAEVVRQVEQVDELLRAAQQHIEEQKVALKTMREQLVAAKKKKRALVRVAEEHREEAAGLGQRRAALLEASMAVDAEFVASTQAEGEAYQRRLAGSNAAKAAAAARASAARQEWREAEAAVGAAGEAARAAGRGLAEGSQRVTRLQGDLARLGEAQSNPTSKFGGQQVVELRRRLDEAHRSGRLRAPVLGPLGSCLSLEDVRWAVAVEAAVGRMLNAFVADSLADQQEFKVSRFA